MSMAAICKDCPKLSRPEEGLRLYGDKWQLTEPVCTDVPNENYARRRRNIIRCTRYRLHLHNYAKSHEVRP